MPITEGRPSENTNIFLFLARVAIGAVTLSLALVLAGGAGAGAQEAGDLNALRDKALAQVNEDRAAHDLPPLTLGDALNAAAQSHAEDMVANDYYAHVSPSGVGPQDRYLDQGGTRAKIVRENIARCTGCDVPPDAERVEAFEEGWMNSPPHRENILSRGLEHFGFGIAGEAGQIFAVQTFAGPGTSPELGPDETAEPILKSERSKTMVEMLNRARERQGLDGLAANEALAEAARDLLPGEDADLLAQNGRSDIFASLPDRAQRDFGALQVISAGCGGCGADITHADLRHFRDQWLDNPQFAPMILSDRFDAAGAAFVADGEGAKRALLLLGAAR